MSSILKVAIVLAASALLSTTASAASITFSGTGTVVKDLTAMIDGNVRGGLLTTNTDTITWTPGSTITKSQVDCVQWYPAQSSRYTYQGVCKAQDINTANTYTVQYECKEPAVHHGVCQGRLIGTGGIYANKSGSASWTSDSSNVPFNFHGTGVWNGM